MDSPENVFRVVPTTPQEKDVIARASSPSAAVDAGNMPINMEHTMRIYSTFLKISCITMKIISRA